MSSGLHDSPGTDSTSAGDEEAFLGSTGNYTMSYGSLGTPGCEITSSVKNRNLQVLLEMILYHLVLLVHLKPILLLLVKNGHF